MPKPDPKTPKLARGGIARGIQFRQAAAAAVRRGEYASFEHAVRGLREQFHPKKKGTN